jgi:hypothetical protein
MDHHFGRLLEGMKRQGLFEDSLILVTADHGELLGEHGKMGHGASLFEEEIRVPFLREVSRRQVAEGRRRAGPPRRRSPLILERLGLALGAQLATLLAEVNPLEFMSPDGSWRALSISGA